MTKGIALVTGAARGIGRHIACTLARDGYAIAVVDINFDGYREFRDENEHGSVLDELHDLNADVLAVEADTTDAAALQECTSAIIDRWGALNALVCNAGGGTGPLDGNRASAIDLDDLHIVLRRNLIGTIATVTATLPALTLGSDGSIITMSSLNGVEPTSDGSYSHYGIAKAAVAHYTRYLAKDLAPRGIRANCVAPGIIATGRLTQRMREAPQANADLKSQLTRVGSPNDIAGLVRYLASPESVYMTGQVLRIDGGV
ncbi:MULTISPECIES: SDR family NAD(P)-dependent oxidoreductase [Rhodococcus]|uniref:Oxidoreductase n=1 Tax=Rhodococcus opacus RKJ300 = JCM 13270 TaxID=1165867 RepID=I0WIW4_RHOOP|nr:MULTISPECIES: SDR family NAD(P)-dependent oxidoreductase [Rhodococcus]EID76330.1 oxidoreductase [Rhodococcus opacus RKJ300 = JCM 13270]QQZ18938.1 SDR family oxidoreductase [Rhodococcus sp. 21391]